MSVTALAWAAAGTGFTFLMTSLGAAVVFLFRKTMNGHIQRVFLGFASGVMIAASIWSLLIPAIEETEASGRRWLASCRRRIYSGGIVPFFIGSIYAAFSSGGP